MRACGQLVRLPPLLDSVTAGLQLLFSYPMRKVTASLTDPGFLSRPTAAAPALLSRLAAVTALIGVGPSYADHR